MAVEVPTGLREVRAFGSHWRFLGWVSGFECGIWVWGMGGAIWIRLVVADQWRVCMGGLEVDRYCNAIGIFIFSWRMETTLGDDCYYFILFGVGHAYN